MSRRAFIRAGAGGAAAIAFSPSFLERALAQVVAGPGPYGPLGAIDANGISLPSGFTSREIARNNTVVPASGGTPYTWHNLTDGQATFPTLTGGGADGGWILVANSEVPGILNLGGASGIEFAPDGTVEQAYGVLAGTSTNCAGGPTPWGTWLSCEETGNGQVHECDPTTNNPTVRPAMGRFTHEAACVDPVNQRVYMTEDISNGCLYRFAPDTYPDLSAGTLEVAVGSAPGTVTWETVPDPSGGGVGGGNPTRDQVAGAVRFSGGEGLWFDKGTVYFTTKGDGRVWTLDTATNAISILYDDDLVGPNPPLQGVDNITVSQSGDIFVCEDGADNDICIITPEGEVTRFLTLDPAIHAGVGSNETVGVVFNPSGSRMYFGVQRSFGGGVVYEITGPFRPTEAKRPVSVKLTAPKSISIRKFLRQGLPINLDITGPVGIVATLSAGARPKTKRKKGKKRKRRAAITVVAESRPSTALDGQVALLLKATTRGRRTLRGRRSAGATLTVTAKGSDGKEIVLTEPVRLTSAKRKKRKKQGPGKK